MTALGVQPQVSVEVKGEARSKREIIEDALAASRGRVPGLAGAAARLGIPRSTLNCRIKALKRNKIGRNSDERLNKSPETRYSPESPNSPKSRLQSFC
jgi:hypothetical protein